MKQTIYKNIFCQFVWRFFPSWFLFNNFYMSYFCYELFINQSNKLIHNLKRNWDNLLIDIIIEHDQYLLARFDNCSNLLCITKISDYISMKNKIKGRKSHKSKFIYELKKKRKTNLFYLYILLRRWICKHSHNKNQRKKEKP